MNKETNIDKFFLTAKRGEVYPKAIADTEKILIEKALERTEGNQLKAAKILGINRNTLHSKIKKLGIEVERWKKY